MYTQANIKDCSLRRMAVAPLALFILDCAPSKKEEAFPAMDKGIDRALRPKPSKDFLMTGFS